jgi:hypothetical protein
MNPVPSAAHAALTTKCGHSADKPKVMSRATDEVDQVDEGGRQHAFQGIV